MPNKRDRRYTFMLFWQIFIKNNEENLNVFTSQKGSYRREYFSENKLEISLFATPVEVSKWNRPLSVEFP